ncbi:hypothetical protein [Devosia sp. SL43]|uniref:hypothetical protein n=1 Tax=Devosia sp. SL43 TaxID=2806348 RepID=UPI001F3D65E0|nr:hypothetical protein [Devosia sp. SL43]UJW84189.1 hypothetical protein IM737_12160 [Devosia sp. SL43]
MFGFANRLFWALAALLALSAPTFAQFNFLPEVRVGIGARGIDDGATLLDPKRIGDANVELLFTAPDLNAWTVVGELRPHLGATVSFRGKDSYGYAGLSWTFQAPVLPVFVEASLGGVARTSMVTAPEGDPSRNFGCGIGLRAAGSVGVNLPAGTSLIATVEHLPDFGTCGAPRANTNLGVRLGFRF